MWLMQQQLAMPLARGVEYAYDETCEVVNGKVICEQATTRNFLEYYGYRVVAQIEDWVDLMTLDIGHALDLAEQGLGPLKTLKWEQVQELRQQVADGVMPRSLSNDQAHLLTGVLTQPTAGPDGALTVRDVLNTILAGSTLASEAEVDVEAQPQVIVVRRRSRENATGESQS